MRIGIHKADNTAFPNLALMKLSAWHQARGDSVSFYDPLFAARYDQVYSSKVFTFTPDSLELFGNISRGGTGYRLFDTLPDEVEHTCPDYTLFKTGYSLGFVTRGCPRQCAWCIVPRKEGGIRPHAPLNEFLRHESVVLMDNNILACEHGIWQIETLADIGVKVDFNQGLDARLVDNAVARLLSRLKFIQYLRLSCDTMSQVPVIQRAVTLLRWHNVNPAGIFVYCLIQDVSEALERIKALKGLYVMPFAQPYRDYDNSNEPTPEQRRFARWVNHKAIFKSVLWEEYQRYAEPQETGTGGLL